MNEQQLAEIINFWSFWEEPPPQSIPRQVNLPQKLTPDRALVIQGIRRCGKSTLLTQLPEHYNLPALNCLYINFEDPRLMGSLNADILFRVVEHFKTKHKAKAPLYFFFDEIQEVVGWEKWLHTQLERNQRNHFTITGSNASLLSGELSSALTGRHYTVELFPFDIAERRLASPDLTVKNFLRMGGFPKATGESETIILLQQYFRDIVGRDIANKVGARSSNPILQVVKMIFESCGSELSLRRIAGACGISVDTASVYLSAAEAAYLIFACPYFSYSTRKQAVRNKKYYPIDTGMRKAITPPGGQDLGKSLETVSFLALKKKFGEVYYWRNNGEVDFVVTHLDSPLPIQVTWETQNTRHEKALEEFYENFPKAHEALYLTQNDLEDNFKILNNYR